MASLNVAKVAEPTLPVTGMEDQSHDYERGARRFVKTSWLALILALLQLMAGVAIIALVGTQLDIVSYTQVENGTLKTRTCYLTGNGHPWGCRYAYALAGLGLLLSTMVLFMKCLHLTASPISSYYFVAPGALGVVWWLVGSSIVTVQDKQADANDLAHGDFRNDVLAMCWVSFGLFLMLALLQLCMAMAMWREMRGIRRRNVRRGFQVNKWVRKEEGGHDGHDGNKHHGPAPLAIV